MEEDNGNKHQLHALEEPAQDHLELFLMELHIAKIMFFTNAILQQRLILTQIYHVHQLYVDL